VSFQLATSASSPTFFAEIVDLHDALH